MSNFASRDSPSLDNDFLMKGLLNSFALRTQETLSQCGCEPQLCSNDRPSKNRTPGPDSCYVPAPETRGHYKKLLRRRRIVADAQLMSWCLCAPTGGERVVPLTRPASIMQPYGRADHADPLFSGK